MPNWKKVVVSGSSAALSNLTVDNAITASGLIYPSSDGTSGQVISTDGSGNLTFNNVSATDAEATHIPVKNTTVSQIDKGTPVYITGNVGGSERLEIAPADASDLSKMPAVGLLETTLAANGEGYVVQGGYLRQIVTDTIDGTATTSNDTVYVKAGGGLTMTKPTGDTNYIQNIAKIARSHGSAGSVIVSSILRTNDVPNLPTGKIWVGDGNTVTSSIVHLDETNGRLGIGTSSPQATLHVEGNITGSGNIDINGTLTAAVKSFDIPHPTQEGKRLVYGVLEGPEHAVYVRGESKADTIILPEEWVGLVDETTITVQLTPVSSPDIYYYQGYEDNTVKVGGPQEKNYFYYIQATRKDVEPLTTVQ